jgi:hypothetical protein
LLVSRSIDSTNLSIISLGVDLARCVHRALGIDLAFDFALIFIARILRLGERPWERASFGRVTPGEQYD